MPIESDFTQCPHLQTFVRCGPHHRAELCILSKEDIEKLYNIWSRYHDDLGCPQYDEKPTFTPEDFDTFYGIAQQVVDAMVDEYQVPMLLDQATISNTNHYGHPPHVDNLRFDSVWRDGKRVPVDEELSAARSGAYILWRTEKTSYRSYSCSVALSDPGGYEGGELQFFDQWGSRSPVARYKCAEGCGIAFCGCHRNIHAVTGVKRGFRLVLLVWTRPPGVRVPEGQDQVCYFRPGTGDGCWLHTAEIRRGLARRGQRELVWDPKPESDDESCNCQDCREERGRVSWKECMRHMQGSPLKSTPSTSAGNSPRSPSVEIAPTCQESGAPTTKSRKVCRQPVTLCGPHGRQELTGILTEEEIRTLHEIWKRHHDDLSNPWYNKKPVFSNTEFDAFNSIAQKVVDAMAVKFEQPLVLDQAAVNSTNKFGHPPHADNVQFDSVWWDGRQIKQRDEVEAARAGAEVLWKESKTTSYRNYSASIALTDPEDYGGGELEFFGTWGSKKPTVSMRLPAGSGMAFCGCQRSIHAVTGVKWGFRLVLLVWTRHPDAVVPKDQLHVCYFRPGSGMSIWLTSEDLRRYGKGKGKGRRSGRKSLPSLPDESEQDDMLEDLSD
ncbi:Hypothetical protein (Fragment) [Durusdinium trenchii]|uniref:procollagen-proline 3-dioxygenase n=1 Tax=Durusdinium trenchii TaxID=1381693 RepID=A0ABP0PMW5_9DINO